MDAMKNMPHLRRMPGRERLDMPTDDFEPRRRSLLLIWGLGFLAVAAIFGLLAGATGVGDRPSLVFVLLALLSAGLGLISLLSGIVRNPP